MTLAVATVGHKSSMHSFVFASASSSCVFCVRPCDGVACTGVMSGGMDDTTTLWDVNEGTPLYFLDAGSKVKPLTFSLKTYLLCSVSLA